MSFELNLAKSSADLIPGDGVVGDQVQQVLFLGLQLGQLGFDGLVHLSDGLLLVVHGLCDLRPYIAQDVRRQRNRGVVPLDVLLDLPGCQVGEVTQLLLPGTTDEVLIAQTASARGFRVYEAGRSSSLVAAIAEQRAFEVVSMDPVSVGGLRTLRQDLLYTVEQRLTDERLVAAGEDLAFVGDQARVVGIVEHLVQLAQ